MPLTSSVTGAAVPAAPEFPLYPSLGDGGGDADPTEEEADGGEQQRLKCVVCIDRGVSHVIATCGHLCLCERCARAVKACPLCRAPKVMQLRVRLAGVAPDPAE